MKIKPEVKEEVREIIRRYDLKLIKRGFIGRDNAICDELQDIGVILLRSGGDKQQQEWAGYEAVMGVHETNGKMYPSRKYFE